MYQFEICANSVESCLAASEGGADRVELCAGIPEGGTTPSYGTIKAARDLPDIRLHVIIRPRGGDFIYSPTEIRTMKEDIRMAKDCSVDGVVFGCLTPDGEVDIPVMRGLMKVASGLSVTFHRAFDHCADPHKALNDIISLGCHRVLTSGQQPTAEKGIPLLKELVVQAGRKIIIMPGCGVNEKNIARIARETGAREFHFSAREEFESPARYVNSHIYMGSRDTEEWTRTATTSRKVREVIQGLQSNY